ncbi:MAG: YqaE/Pmp3 family membrane protein [Bacteroidota bacterium]
MSTSSRSLISIIVTVFLPPLGVAMHEGITSRFWISLVLTLLFFIPGLIYSLYVILN